MNNKIRISAISYLNTFPFLYGIYKNEQLLKQIDLKIDYPSACAVKLQNYEADIGIVPVASLPKIKNYSIVSQYCISSRYVRSVMLFSQVPLNKIQTVLLDYQSMSSVNLTKIMSKKFWNISPEWKNTSSGYESLISGTTAGLVIGDRALNLINKYDYQYDLAQQWLKFTELPFVFAVWAANKKLDSQFIKNLDLAFDYGLKNIDSCIEYFADKIKEINYDSKLYLTQNIDYLLDEDKMKSIKLFTEYLNELN